MKVVGTILKVVAALAAIAGIVYVAATYGDKIVAWAKRLLGRCECECECECTCEDDCENCNCEDNCDECACECACDCECKEEAPAAEEAPAEEAPAEEGAVQAEETDFEG